MATAMVEDSGFEDGQLAAMAIDDVVRASRLLDNEIRILKTAEMATTSGKILLCFLHIRGRFEVSRDGDLTYVGGSVRSRTIKEGTSLEEFKIMISSIVEKESGGLVMKFTLPCDRTTFVDIVDDEVIEHLINYSGESGHVYVDEGQNEDDNTTAIRDDRSDEQYVFDNLSEGWDGGSATMSIEDSPALQCAVQMVPIGTPKMNSTKWKDLIIGEGQVFVNADGLRQTLYKYGIAHKFAYKYVKKTTRKRSSPNAWLMDVHGTWEHIQWVNDKIQNSSL